MFGPDEKTQANNISKLISFFENNWYEILKISRRTESQADRYAAKYGVTDIVNAKKFGRSKSESRYSAVNNTNSDTVEIRIMRGTLNYAKFLASVDFCINAVNNSRKIKWKDVFCIPKWLQGLKPETMEYIRSRKAFEGVELCA